MKVSDPHEFRSRDAMRAWLQENGTKKHECWVVLPRDRKNVEGLLYIDAVEEALCFGWIDGICKTFSVDKLVHRFSPRRKNSSWTELNKERCRKMIKLGKMTDADRAVLPDLNPDNFVVDEEIINALKATPDAWENFEKFPGLYKRIRIYNIQSIKRNKRLFESRLKKFVEKTAQNIMFGDWNDNGRLLNY